MDFFTKVKDLLNKDVSAENELKDMAVLLRILCIADAIFHFIHSIIFFLNFGVYMGTLALVYCLGMIAILCVTYRDKTRLSLLLYAGLLIISMVSYCAYFGAPLGYHFGLFTVVLLFYFKTNETPAFKMFCSLVCAFLYIAAVIYVGQKGASFSLINGLETLLFILNSISLFLKITIISRFYCLKFSSSEEKIIQYAKKLEHLATIDTLTQLQNRRGMMKHLIKLADGYSSTNQPFSLVLSDVDFFKKVNDTYGHDTGDYVLVNLAALFEDFMKDKGRVARWGGEEFLFVFEGTNGDFVFEELNKLKFLVEKTIFSYKDYHFSITMTFGLEEYDSNIGIEKTIEKADEKLYQGKEHGRNCVIY